MLVILYAWHGLKLTAKGLDIIHSSQKIVAATRARGFIGLHITQISTAKGWEVSICGGVDCACLGLVSKQ